MSIKFSALAAETVIGDNDIFPFVPDGGASAKKIAFTALKTALDQNGTVTVSTPVRDMTQTWNAGGVTFTALKLNITDTASAAASLLLDLQVGAVSKFSVRKDGSTVGTGRMTASDFINSSGLTQLHASGFFNGSGGVLSWESTASITGSPDLVLRRDAANILAQRNGTTAQELRVYNTFTDVSNYERGLFKWTGNALWLGAEAAGSGTARQLVLLGAGLLFRCLSGGGDAWQLTTAGHFTCSGGDNVYDIGSNGAQRPRTAYFGTSLVAGGATALTASAPVLNAVQTWNNSGVSFTGLRLNVTDTASLSGSVLLDLQIGGGTKFKVNKDGTILIAPGASGSLSLPLIQLGAAAAGVIRLNNAAALTGSSTTFLTGDNGTAGRAQVSSLGFQSSLVSAGNSDLILEREAANILALRNGTNSQELRIYNTFTDASNYERAFTKWSSNILNFGTESAGTGTARSITIAAASNSGVKIRSGGIGIVTISAASGLTFDLDNNYDIGASGANRPRDIFAAGKIKGQLQTHANAVTETIVPDKTITLYDAAGTAYKVPCVAA